jgi:hypothetical protein
MSVSIYGLREADCAVDTDDMVERDEEQAGLNECCRRGCRDSNSGFVGGTKASARQIGLVNVEFDAIVVSAKKILENRNLIGRMMEMDSE